MSCRRAPEYEVQVADANRAAFDYVEARVAEQRQQIAWIDVTVTAVVQVCEQAPDVT